MAYIGKAPNTAIVNQATSQSFSGNGSTTFTLNRSVNRGEDLEVFVENVQQEPGAGKSYTASGTTLTFDAAPPNGTNNIYVIYRGEATINPRLEHDANAALAATTGTFSGDVAALGHASVGVNAVDATRALTVAGSTDDTSASALVVYNASLSSKFSVRNDGFTSGTGPLEINNGTSHASATVKGGNATTNYSGGSLLLSNPGMDTNYGGTYLYHHKAGGSGNQNAAFNISQRTAAGVYVSNIWNVDYQNNAQAFYLPNGTQSGAVVLNLDSSGSVSMSKQPFAALSIANPPAMTTSGGLHTTGSLDINNGNVWNSSTHRFTAPTAGNYMFIVTGYTTFTTQYGYISLYKNGGNYKTHHFNHNGNQIHTIGTLSMAIPLVANDYLELRQGGAGTGHWQQLYLTIFKAT
jgi:hypothetical protein